MPFEFAIQLLSVLLVFRTVESLSCDTADWLASLDRVGWSVCPRSNTYLVGLLRSSSVPGDERVGRIEQGRCCEAADPTYANQPASCKNANWYYLLDG